MNDSLCVQHGHPTVHSRPLVDGRGVLHRAISQTMADSTTEDGTDLSTQCLQWLVHVSVNCWCGVIYNVLQYISIICMCMLWCVCICHCRCIHIRFLVHCSMSCTVIAYRRPACIGTHTACSQLILWQMTVARI